MTERQRKAPLTPAARQRRKTGCKPRPKIMGVITGRTFSSMAALGREAGLSREVIRLKILAGKEIMGDVWRKVLDSSSNKEF